MILTAQRYNGIKAQRRKGVKAKKGGGGEREIGRKTNSKNEKSIKIA
jgi:hypothetical protein